MSSIDARYADYRAAALRIWEYAEVGYKEYKSTVLLQDILKKAGFSVQAGVAEIPTAFVATYGSGKPVIGILAEFDALPGLSQQAVPEKTTTGSFGRSCLWSSFVWSSIGSGRYSAERTNGEERIERHH